MLSIKGRNHDMLTAALEGTAVLLAGITSGTAFYITAVENPARNNDENPDAFKLRMWHQLFPRAAGFLKPFGMVVNAAIGGCIYQTGNKAWWIPFGLFAAMGPFTVFAITPTNDKILALKEGNAKDEKEAGKLVEDWATLHNVRTAISTFGFIGAIVAAMTEYQ
ncbi:Domain of unknown function (DUF1772) [Seminavis robusta]|uniref:DUF1772-domain-containing protein n=1 Tax=Seminavis robusta TaxID=568900 RepID=A0A9N8DF59_9STRA|nr:Domain of unknown function (DUF1772) [Seminavis robusta]|eukprot:Sro128_g061040.1 Domain of unknown function (DUF1772) (164) ;mRNA; f:8827-9318